MGNSIVLAQIIGPMALVLALHVLFYKKYLLKMVDDLMHGGVLHFLAGFFALLIGMLIITFHNVWVSDWPVIITLIGWLSFLKGAVFMLASDVLQGILKYVKKATMYFTIAGVIWLLVGVYLIYVGFFA